MDVLHKWMIPDHITIEIIDFVVLSTTLLIFQVSDVGSRKWRLLLSLSLIFFICFCLFKKEIKKKWKSFLRELKSGCCCCCCIVIFQTKFLFHFPSPHSCCTRWNTTKALPRLIWCFRTNILSRQCKAPTKQNLVN